MAAWSFLTNHARALLFIADAPDIRLRDLADALGVTERTAFGIVADLTESGYLMKEREGRRNRYEVRADLPMHDKVPLTGTIGELLTILAKPGGSAQRSRRATDRVGVVTAAS